MASFNLHTFKKAIKTSILLDLAEWDTIPEENMPNHELLLRKIYNTHDSRKTKTRIISKKRIVAAIIAAALLIASAITAVAFKEKLLDFLEIKTDTHTSLFTPENENANEEIKEIFLPTYIPDGYIAKSYNATSQSVISVWNNGNNDIYFKQLPIKNTSFAINTEDDDYIEAVFGGQPIYYSVKHNIFGAVWHTEDYVYNLNAPWDIGIEEIEKIITSISS